MNEIPRRTAEGLSLANFIPYLFVLRLSENTYKVLCLDQKGNFESYLAFSKHTKWLLTAAVAVVPLKTMEK